MTSTDSAQQPADAPAKAPAKDPWDLPDVSGLVVGVLGGTGPQGKGLAYRLARAWSTSASTAANKRPSGTRCNAAYRSPSA